MIRDMRFSIELVDARGCSIRQQPTSNGISATIEYFSKCFFTVAKRGSLNLAEGYVEFLHDSYSVLPSQTHARVRIRRRGGLGKKKIAEIFTRDMTAEEGRDYFNEVGLITFGPTDTYKTAKVRLSRNRGLAERSFRLELGNDEGNQDMNRQYETEIKIKPIKWNIDTVDVDTDDDTDDIPDEDNVIDFDSALEAVDRIVDSFDISEINVKEPHFIKDVMYFDKQAFYYWLDEGVVEIALEMKEKLTGSWRTMDESATAKTHYKPSSGKIVPDFNMLEIRINENNDETKPIGFGIEVVDSTGRKIQTAIVLQPFDLA